MIKVYLASSNVFYEFQADEYNNLITKYVNNKITHMHVLGLHKSRRMYGALLKKGFVKIERKHIEMFRKVDKKKYVSKPSGWLRCGGNKGLA